jgi:predicted nucleic acid-binding protein
VGGLDRKIIKTRELFWYPVLGLQSAHLQMCLGKVSEVEVHKESVAQTFVFLDTNIMVRFLIQDTPKFEDSWTKLNEFLIADNAHLLVPELVLLELQKKKRTLSIDVTKKTETLRRAIEESFRKESWNELDGLKSAVENHFREEVKDILAGIELRYVQVIEFLNGAGRTTLPFDADIWFRGNRRRLGKGLADPDKNQVADCCLIESVIKFFESRSSSENCSLLFCSNNTSDFALKVEGKEELHPCFANDFPIKASKLFLDLQSLVAF